MSDDVPAVPALQIRHAEAKDWCVAAKWPDGHVEDIVSFDTEAKANEWIATDFQAWLEARRNGGSPPYRSPTD
jgi:hypothetical protein